MFNTALVEDPTLVDGKAICAPGFKALKAPLGKTKKVKARSGAAPFAVNVKTEGTPVSVNAMET
jgi:hypothetical protein